MHTILLYTIYKYKGGVLYYIIVYRNNKQIIKIYGNRYK